MSQKKDAKGRNLKQNEDQLKDGRYRYRYTDIYGNRKSIYSWKLTTTDKTPIGKKEDLCLRVKIKNLEKDLNDNIDIDKSKIIVNDLIKKYIDTKPKLANSTRANYIHIWEKNIANNKLGIMKICNVKKSDILQFYSYLFQERNFKVSTIQLYQNLLFPAFQMAVDDLIIRVNPCRNCMKDYIRGSLSSTKHPLTRSEQKVLINYIKNDDVYQSSFTIIAFMLSTGCRVGETIGLTWEDIDFENKYISINHQVLYRKKDGKFQYYISSPKNGDSRIIPIEDGLISVLKKHRRNTFLMSKSSGFMIDGYQNFVFINNAGKVQTPNTIVRTFHGIREAYNKKELDDSIKEKREPILLPDFTPHTLRHTFCTRMSENGIDIKALQEIMGHKNISITMQIYNHVDVDRVKKALKNVEPALEIPI